MNQHLLCCKVRTARYLMPGTKGIRGLSRACAIAEGTGVRARHPLTACLPPHQVSTLNLTLTVTLTSALAPTLRGPKILTLAQTVPHTW